MGGKNTVGLGFDSIGDGGLKMGPDGLVGVGTVCGGLGMDENSGGLGTVPDVLGGGGKYGGEFRGGRESKGGKENGELTP